MDEKQINLILGRGVSQYTDPEKRLETFLRATKDKRPRFVVKFGVDPTRPDIHIGHAVNLHKLRALQDAGALVVFLIGDFTAMIGDPTGKSKVRPEISQQEVEANMKTYLEQVGKILDLDPTKFSWIRNSDWFSSPMDISSGPDTKVELGVSHNGEQIKVALDPNSFEGKAALFHATRMQVTHLKSSITHNVSLINFLAILRKLTYARLIERDMFQKRLKDNEELYLHEMMYPVFQAIDSHVIARIYGTCDMEMGGSDQTFNMLMGRDVMKVTNQPPQAVMAMDLLVGTDGAEKMSKSLGNYISIVDTPSDMYGKVMSIPDKCMKQFLELATFTPTEEIARILQGLEKGTEHPRDVKMSIAKQLVATYHGEQKAKEAEENFIRIFQEGGAPKEFLPVVATKGEFLHEILTRGVLASKTVFKRYVAEGAIAEITDQGETKVTDVNYCVEKEMKLRVGKKDFIKITLS